MSYVRADGYRLTNPDDDAAFQVVIGDLQRLALALYKGSPNAAYTMAPWAAAGINGIDGLNGLDGQASGGPGAQGVGTGSGGPSAAPPTAGSSNLSDLTNPNDALDNLGIGQYAIVPTVTSVYTGSSGTHTFSGVSRRFLIYVFGGGGGGGGGFNDGIFSYGGRGGGAGSCLIISGGISGGLSLSYTVGSGGAGGLSSGSGSGNLGSNGGSSIININLGTYTAGGGRGGGAYNTSGYVSGDYGSTGGAAQFSANIWPQVIGIPGKDGQGSHDVGLNAPGLGIGSFYYFYGGLGGGGWACDGASDIGAGGAGGNVDVSSAYDGTAGNDGRVFIFESSSLLNADGEII